MSDLDLIATPLTDTPEGIDPAYEDAFVAVKNEINKLQSNDYMLVHDLSWKILTETSKDLRVAGYYLLAATFTQGIEGLVKGATTYEILTSKFGETCHPKRPRAKEASLRWLNTPKLETFAKEYAQGGSNDDYLKLRDAISQVNKYASAIDSTEPPVWNGLDAWLNEQIVDEPSTPEENQPDLVDSQQTNPQTAEGLAKPTTQPTNSMSDGVRGDSTINSDQEVITLTRLIREYFLDKKEYIQAVAYSRALRWGGLKTPPHDNKTTKLPAIRAGAMTQLSHAQANEEPQEVFLLCENLFLEPGGQVNLDIQYAASNAAKAMGNLELSDFITAQVLELISRLPELPHLQFADGEVFAIPETKKWLKKQQSDQSGDNKEHTVTWEDEIAPIIAEAKELTAKKKLGQGLTLLQNIQTRTSKDNLLKKMHMAELCQTAKRHDMALPVLQELQQVIETQSLQIWDPSLVSKIYSQLILSLQACINKTKKDEKRLLEQQLTTVKDLLCKIDLAAAANLF